MDSVLIFAILLVAKIGTTGAIDCYTCTSMGGSDRKCEDPVYKEFLNITPNCQVPIMISVNNTNEGEVYYPNVIATEPAKFCVKTIGTTQDKRQQLVIRTCVSRDMNSQCGTFEFRNQTVRGCMLTCATDLCNSGKQQRSSKILKVSTLLIITAFLFSKH